MFNNTALDIVISLTFVYLLYSLLGTLLQEMIATNVGLRARILRKAIRRMLDDSKDDKKKVIKSKEIAKPVLVSEAFYCHPLVKYLASGTGWPLQKIPAYISSETFSKVLIDLLRGTDLEAGDAYDKKIQKSLKEGKIAWMEDSYICQETLKYLRSLWIDAQGDVQKFKILLEQWFDEMMFRTTGWYKKWTQIILLGVGLGIAITFNVDTIKIIKKLEHDPKLRAQVVGQANDFAKSHPQIAGVPDTAAKVRNELYNQAAELIKGDGDVSKTNELLALGWGNKKNTDCTSILGWLLTALAISLGAPFWFDLLNKLTKLRSSSNNDDKSKPDNEKGKPGTVPAIERAG